jgi:hypothetical protein
MLHSYVTHSVKSGVCERRHTRHGGCLPQAAEAGVSSTIAAKVLCTKQTRCLEATSLQNDLKRQQEHMGLAACVFGGTSGTGARLVQHAQQTGLVPHYWQATGVGGKPTPAAKGSTPCTTCPAHAALQAGFLDHVAAAPGAPGQLLALHAQQAQQPPSRSSACLALSTD